MSSVSFNRNRAKLKTLLGIRARLALLALILVVPLMLERVRSLEDTRSKEIAPRLREKCPPRPHSGRYPARSHLLGRDDAEIGRLYPRLRRHRAQLRNPARQPADQPALDPEPDDALATTSGTVRHVPILVGPRSQRAANTSKKAQETRDFVFSDYLFASRHRRKPILMAAYPVAAINPEEDAVVVAGINLDWMSKIMANLAERPGILRGGWSTAPASCWPLRRIQASMIGRPLDNVPLLASIADKALETRTAPIGLAFVRRGRRLPRAVNFARIPGTQIAPYRQCRARPRFTAAINREIRTAYLQLGFVCLFVLLGALIGAEKLIINPIEVMTGMARRFGDGDWSARVARSKLPAEFNPLARAFNAMAAQLSQRERELVATNDRLTVMASIDMLSGLANRRGFQSRLDFEWMKAQQYGSELSLLMIDVDHFKLYNDTYGHPEGDACLTRLGETLSGIAADTLGLCRPLWRPEFCLLLPNTECAEGARDRREGSRGGAGPADTSARPQAIRPSP